MDVHRILIPTVFFFSMWLFFKEKTFSKEIISKVFVCRLLVFKGITLCKDRDQQRNAQLQGRHCRCDEEGLGCSSQIQPFTGGKRLLLLSELGWAEPG